VIRIDSALDWQWSPPAERAHRVPSRQTEGIGEVFRAYSERVAPV
jgi:hypothetical protein